MNEAIVRRLGAVVKATREKKQMNQRELSKLSGYAPNNLSRFESGQQRPSDTILEKIAQALDTTISALYIQAESDAGSNVSPAPDLVELVPLLGYTTAGAFRHVRELEPHEIEEWFPTVKRLNGHGFALRIEGDSMTATHGRSIPDGAIAVFNANNRNPENGDLVLAKISGADEITFKKYVTDAGKSWLMPLNTTYPPIHEKFKVLAVYVHAIIF